MAFGLGIPCLSCGCVPPCNACSRSCKNPHDGGTFAAVYTRYQFGAEAGNPSDGYLAASGDSDTSDPYDGMDGIGPWHQDMGGTFTISSAQTRFPCAVRVSFWRSNYVLGVNTIPPPSTSLTSQSTTVTVTDGAVVVGDRVIVPADGAVTISTVSIPLVSGNGDQSAADPKTADGSIFVAPKCDSATFSIRARIDWNTKKRQHVLYGLVRECYEGGSGGGASCATYCSGSPPPNVVYLTISNYSGPSCSSCYTNGTYALSRYPSWCNSYYAEFAESNCSSVYFYPEISKRVLAVNGPIATGSIPGIYIGQPASVSGACKWLELGVPSVSVGSLTLCGTGVLYSGTNGCVAVSSSVSSAFSGRTWSYTNCFDWKIEA